MIPEKVRALIESAGKHPLIMAIDGNSASGKSMLSNALEKEMGAQVIHMDHFFLQPHQRTGERFLTPGGNVDMERFVEEVYAPLKNHQDVHYRVFDCGKMDFDGEKHVKYDGLIVVEGVYAMHEQVRDVYDLSVFMQIDPETQSARILHRNGEWLHKKFVNEWIPMENAYFDFMQVASHCTLLL